MLLSVFPLSYSNFPAENINDNISDESSTTADYEITMTPNPAYDTTQFTFNQSSEDPYTYVDVQP